MTWLYLNEKGLVGAELGSAGVDGAFEGGGGEDAADAVGGDFHDDVGAGIDDEAEVGVDGLQDGEGVDEKAEGGEVAQGLRALDGGEDGEEAFAVFVENDGAELGEIAVDFRLAGDGELAGREELDHLRAGQGAGMGGADGVFKQDALGCFGESGNNFGHGVMDAFCCGEHACEIAGGIRWCMKLTDVRTLGRSGLIVSPLCLGTMTFGNPRWGSEDAEARSIFDAYVGAGGNFIDTADVYVKGVSEELVGRYVAEGGLRDRLVVATKFTFNAEPGNPNAGGNGRKNLYRALEGSLRRLRMDYVDLYWVHAWDQVTPVEELLQSLGDLVRAGTIRYFGLSDVPAWYATEMATLARVRGVPGPVALQMPYSLAERSIEREHAEAARQMGMGMTPWGALGAGLLTGKYTRDADGTVKSGGGRLDLNLPSFQMFTEGNWRALEVLRGVAEAAGKPLGQVALAWVLAQPGVTSPIVGASRLVQLEDQMAALEVVLTAEQMKTLDEGTALPGGAMDRFFKRAMRPAVFGGGTVQGWGE